MRKILLCLFLFTGTGSLLYAQHNTANSLKTPKTKATAGTADTTKETNTQNLFPAIQLQFYLGYQGLRSHEYVLGEDGNSRGHISELIWNSFKNLLFGANISGELNNRYRYLLQVSSTVSLGKNFIYDYDWLFTDTQDVASNYSRHDTRQDFMLEVLGRWGFLLLKNDHARITLGPGLFFSFAHWEAFDGEARYHIPGTVGQLSGHIFTYKVLLLAPQIYLEFIQSFNPQLELRFSVAYSPFTFWLDQDNHYSRNLFFVSYGFLGQQIFGELLLNFWNKHHNFAIGIGVNGRYLFEAKGNSVEFNANDDGKPTSEESSHKSAAGIEQGSVQLYLGVTFSFPKLKRN